MATIGNANEATFTDGSGPTGDVLNINTSSGLVQIPNGKGLAFYSDAYTTLTAQIKNGTLAPTISSTAAAIANAGTVATANVGIARLNPASAVTGIIMAAGTFTGQQCWVVNEATVEKTVSFDVAGTSNVADGVNQVIPGLQARLFVWDGAKSLWYSTASFTSAGTLALVQSSPGDPGNAGTFTTAGVAIVRTNPAAARTGMIMQAGTFPGQICIVVNESVAARSVTFDIAGTSNVADGANITIFGLQAKLFVWDSGNALWIAQETFFVNGTLATVMSATSPDPGAGGTITTSGVGIALVTPAAARSGIILQAGTVNGQEVWIVNQGSAANTLTLNTTPATANVADSATEAAIAGLTARKYVWVGGSTNLWYPAK